MASPFSNPTGATSITATEFSLPANANYSSGSPQTTPLEIEPIIDTSAMVAGDQYRFRIYEKMNGGTQQVLWEGFATGVTPSFRLPPCRVQEGWDVTAKLITGSARTLGWALREDVGDRNLVKWLGSTPNVLTAGGRVDADPLAVPLDNSLQLGALLRGVVRLILGKHSGWSTGTVIIRDLADSKNSITIVTTSDGRTSVTFNDLT